MRNNLSKFTKTLTSMACFSLILISNNSELAAKYLLSNEIEFDKDKINIQNINQYVHDPISAFNFNNVLIVDNGKKNSAENVLISEIIIEGWEDHPEGRKFE
jgi:outer membrane protein insertion porin family